MDDIHHFQRRLEGGYRALAKEQFSDRDKVLLRGFTSLCCTPRVGIPPSFHILTENGRVKIVSLESFVALANQGKL
jgi:hypothetical protein